MAGWGHALEHDVRTPESHPLALEFLLTVLRMTDLPRGNLLDGAAEWVEANQNPDGSLRNPASFMEYPHAPWWNEGGQSAPDSITGDLEYFGASSPAVNEATRRWVTQNLTLEKIAANDWLFMAYHPYHYYFGVSDFPELETYRTATVENMIACVERAPENQLAGLVSFAPSPESPVAKRLRHELIEGCLDLNSVVPTRRWWLGR